jgi:hypothetical protein
MPNADTVPEQKTNDGIDDASTNETDVISTQELVDSMVAIQQCRGCSRDFERLGKFGIPNGPSSFWTLLNGDKAQETALRERLEEVLSSLHQENPNVSQVSTSTGQR